MEEKEVKKGGGKVGDVFHSRENLDWRVNQDMNYHSVTGFPNFSFFFDVIGTNLLSQCHALAYPSRNSQKAGSRTSICSIVKLAPLIMISM